MRPRNLRAISITLVVILAGATGCSRPAASYPGTPGPGEFSVLTYNLDVFAYADRDGDGQADEFKPDEHVLTIARTIATMRPDVAALQEVGSADALDQLRRKVTEAGHAMPHADFLPAPAGGPGLGLLSRHPFVSSQHLTNLHYSIKDKEWPVSRGFQQADIETGASSVIRVMNVHLKSKVFHPSGQTEMRRNEARLLAAQIRNEIETSANIPLLVCGDFGDTPGSASTREITGAPSTGLRMLDLVDQQGEGWTSYDSESEIWSRQHFILASSNLASRLRQDKSGIAGGSGLSSASRHRPLVAVFSAAD